MHTFVNAPRWGFPDVGLLSKSLPPLSVFLDPLMADPQNEAVLQALQKVASFHGEGLYRVSLEEAIQRATLALLSAIETRDYDLDDLIALAHEAALGP